jgi:hypothetical protein
MSDYVFKLILGGVGGFMLAAIIIGLLIFLFPTNVEKIVGWVASGVARLWRRADKTAVARRVQGEVNGCRASILRDAPNVITKKLKIKWTDAEEAEARVRGGDVVVFMRDSKHHDENVTTAVMAYLPKALIPRARRYIEADTMRAVDLTVARSILAHEDASEGALDIFFERHLDPARAGSDRLKAKVAQLDRVDMHGWLSRILLMEYRRLGELLYPGDPTEECLSEAEAFADWLSGLANRPPGSTDGSLTFKRKHFKVAIVLVAQRETLLDRGVEPYRKRTKRHLYADRYDSVYLLARDHNMDAVEEILASLEGDAMVASVRKHVFPLRPDFKIRVLHRDRSICACLRRRQQSREAASALADDDSNLPLEETGEPIVSTGTDTAVMHDDDIASSTAISASSGSERAPEPR